MKQPMNALISANNTNDLTSQNEENALYMYSIFFILCRGFNANACTWKYFQFRCNIINVARK